MHDTTRPTDRVIERVCRRCAEPVAADVPACGFCGDAMPPHKAIAVRLAEAASLAAVLLVIVVACRFLGNLLGI